MTQDPLIMIENVSIAQWIASISWVYKQKWSDHLTCSWNLSPKKPLKDVSASVHKAT